ncbi:ABC transporter substrate-binding protein [Krasilnikoviella flava]|uniref:Carbohydrate ABC transporter substrate-binding protein, CUT1 family (TC 3.A.1.1.-) n=1 Tax=Krasilnikoviella flava TaxID=526729 RepID=A0A1T5IG11_9MICO|nr:ABC transporter substrate-binding protein [Krasilnikoviella flava]SKC38136.1 carbohydrate ABC transporter substrate-binding protein, CUT1 family (TC 3.A.1.1.-) [Krasilnikoviella flava]
MRSLTRRAVLRALGVAGATAAVAGCAPTIGTARMPQVAGTYDGPPVTLRFWNGLTGGDGPVMRTLIEEFTAAHPNVRIDMYALPWPDFYQKFPAAVVSGLAPDLALMHNFQVATSAARNVIMPVDEVLGAVGLAEADYLPVVWGSGVYRGQRWSLPLDMWPDSLFYNRRVLEKAGLDPDAPPVDRAGYEAALDTLASSGVRGHWLPAIDPQGVGRGFDSLLWQLGGTHYDDAGRSATWAGPEGVEALAWQQSLVRQGWSPNDVSGSDANVAFKNDQNAFLWGGPGALINDLGQVESLDWDVSPLPRIGTQRAAFSGSHQFVVARQQSFDADRLAAVVTFLGWILENSLGWASAGPVPARLPVLQSPELQDLPAQAHVAQGVEHIRFYPLVPGIAEVQTTILYPAVGDALLSLGDPRAALETAAAQASFLLTENAEKYGEA